MNKESIYKIIGYNGEYNANVKKAIRKLLKENHPDNKGDAKVFELINEVKKELEDNKVSYNVKKTENANTIIDDIDYDYCYRMIKLANKEKNICINKLDELNKELKTYTIEYKDNYQNNIELETNMLSNSKYVDELKNTKYRCILCLIFAIILFIIAVWSKKIVFLALFVFVTIICVFVISNSFFTIQKITENSKVILKKYVSANSKLRENLSKQDELKKEIYDLKKQINNLDNDLRFYHNILDNRG